MFALPLPLDFISFRCLQWIFYSQLLPLSPLSAHKFHILWPPDFFYFDFSPIFFCSCIPNDLICRVVNSIQKFWHSNHSVYFSIVFVFVFSRRYVRFCVFLAPLSWRVTWVVCPEETWGNKSMSLAFNLLLRLRLRLPPACRLFLIHRWNCIHAGVHCGKSIWQIRFYECKQSPSTSRSALLCLF